MRLRTLGGVALDETVFSRPKPLLLLAYLTLEGRQSRRHVAELFWPKAADRMKSLTVALSRLRKGAPGAIDADERWVWSKVEADATGFLRLLERGETATALASYQGPFLDGFYLRDWSAELEEWVYATREFLAAHARKGLLELAEEEAARGAFEAAAKQAEAAYALKGAPLCEPEELVRLHTLLCAAESPLAAEVAKEVQAFEVPPVTSPQAAREQLGQAVAARRAPTPHNLPPRATGFVGRDLELAEIATLLSRSDCRLMTLLGPPGVGKTRLALQVAQEQLKLGAFKDGIYLVSLESLTAASSIPAALAGALALEPSSSADPFEQVAAHIGAKEMLLVCDNLEQLTSGSTVLAELMARCPNLRLLVTSRERLNLEEERIFPVAGLPFPESDDIALDDARRFDAVALFERRAKRARPDFSLENEALPHVLKLCRLVEGLPLGLELAAVWLRVMPVHEIAADVATSLDLLATPTRNLPARHRSLRAAFEQAWQRLTAKEQGVLRTLAVFRGGFRREAASDVAGATIPILASLVDKSLLRASPSGRFDRHPLLQQYYREKLLADPEEAARAEASHGAYYVGFLERWYGALRGEGQRHALEVIDEELENLRAAVRWAVTERKPDEVQRVSWPLAMAFYMAGRPHDGLTLLTQALAAWEGSDLTRHPACGHARLAQAWLAYSAGRFADAAEFARASLERLRAHDDHRGVNRALNTLGGALWRMGDYPQAQRCFQEGLALARESDDAVSVKTYLSNLAIVAKDAGNYARAKACLEEVIALLGGTRDLQFVQLLNTLAGLELALGHHAQAEQACQEGLQLAKEMNFQRMVPYFVFNLGRVAHERGDHAQALSRYREALQLLQDAKDRSFESQVLTALGNLSLARNALAEARTHLVEALARARSRDDLPATLDALGVLAALWAKQGEVGAAVGLWGLVSHHPSATQELKERTRSALSGVLDELAPEVLEAALERGKALKLEHVVLSVLQQAEARP